MLLLDNEIQGLMKLYFLNMNIAWKKSFEGFFFVFSICFSFCGHSNEHECHKRLFEHLFLLIRKYISVRALVWKITATNMNVISFSWAMLHLSNCSCYSWAIFGRFSWLVIENGKKPELQYEYLYWYHVAIMILSLFCYFPFILRILNYRKEMASAILAASICNINSYFRLIIVEIFWNGLAGVYIVRKIQIKLEHCKIAIILIMYLPKNM